MKTIKKILSRLRDLFRRKRTMTVPVVPSTFMNTLYGTVVPAKPAPCAFLFCHRPGGGYHVDIIRVPNSTTLFP